MKGDIITELENMKRGNNFHEEKIQKVKPLSRGILLNSATKKTASVFTVCQ